MLQLNILYLLDSFGFNDSFKSVIILQINFFIVKDYQNVNTKQFYGSLYIGDIIRKYLLFLPSVETLINILRSNEITFWFSSVVLFSFGIP